MSKSKKITFGMIAADMEKPESEIVKFGGVNKEFEIEVRRNLDFKGAMGFVHSIAASCASLDSGEYTPEVFDFAVRVNTLIYYAGFEGSEDTLKAYDVAYRSGLYDDITEVIDIDQYGVLLQAARTLVNYTRESIIAFQSAKVNELIDKMDEVMREGNSVVETLTSEEMNEKLGEMMRIANIGRTEPAQESAEAESNNIVELKKE